MNKSSDVFMHASAIPHEDVGAGIQRQMLGFDPSIMMVKARFDQGSVGEVHSHEHVQVTYVESGCFEVSINGEVRLLEAGDAFYVPPNAPHGAVCRSPGVLIDVFSPLREDFLAPEDES